MLTVGWRRVRIDPGGVHLQFLYSLFLLQAKRRRDQARDGLHWITHFSGILHWITRFYRCFPAALLNPSVFPPSSVYTESERAFLLCPGGMGGVIFAVVTHF